MGRRVYYDSAGNEIGLDEDAYHLSNTVPLFVQNVQTNADRIRAMTDEELATWLGDMLGVYPFGTEQWNRQAWLEWLREEVTE